MGKYEKWQDARREQHAAREQYSDASGGSTEAHYQASFKRLKDADADEAKTWNEFKEDPNGG